MNDNLEKIVDAIEIEELKKIRYKFIEAWYRQKSDYQLEIIDKISERIDRLEKNKEKSR